MKLNSLNNAIGEAKRFIKAAEKVKVITDTYSNGKPWVHLSEYSKESAACKRASMDLTRALAEMRKPS